MKLSRDALGYVPFWAMQATFFACVVITAAVAYRSHRYGPSVRLVGIKDVTMIAPHRSDEAYATVLAKRFVHEYMNWSHQGHVNAKRRAAALCRPSMGMYLLRQGIQRDHYYQQLLMSSSAQITDITLKWSDEKQDRYVIDIIAMISENQAHVSSQYRMACRIQLGPKEVPDLRPFELEVETYNFVPLSDPVTIPTASEDTDPLNDFLFGVDAEVAVEPVPESPQS